MAEEKRGGRRVPKNPAPYSGVGKQSRRTDGGPIRGVPNVQDGTDLSQGDRAKLEAGQRIAPLRSAPTAHIDASQGGRPMGGGMGGGGMPPEHLMAVPTTRPGEPETEGLALGPGAGPEVLTPPEPDGEMEEFLQAMVSLTGDASIAQMMDDHREFKTWKADRSRTPMPTTAQGPVGKPPSSPNEDELGLGLEGPDLSAPIGETLPETGAPEDISLEASGGDELEQPSLLSEETGGDAEMVGSPAGDEVPRSGL